MVNIEQLRDESCPGGMPVQLTAEYAGIAQGGRAHVVASGPSARAFAEYDLPDDDWVIVCNGAIIEYAGLADIWLLMESTLPVSAPWFVQSERALDGVRLILDASCVGHLQRSPSRIAAYSDDWWRDVVWCHRWPYGKGGYKSFRDSARGLYYRSSADEPEGSVTLQAIHLAGIMGVSEVHLWGAEFVFPDGEQHFYGDKPYEAGGQVTSLIHFTITSDSGGPAITDDCGLASTPYFIRSADAIKNLAIDGQNDMRIVNHSGGLLDLDSDKLRELARLVTRKYI